MAKRFTDTDIWDKKWFMALSPKEKCLVKFIFDKCDVAGIWSPNWGLATAYIGETVGLCDLDKFSYRLEFLGEKIFVADFIEFQYGELSDKCKPHQKIIATLKKHGLFERVSKGYTDPIERVQEEDKEEDKEENLKNNKGVILATWPTMPGPEQIDLDLPEVKAGAARELMTITGNPATAHEVSGLWKVFKTQHFTGNKFYATPDDAFSHFINWSKTQKINGKAHQPALGSPQFVPGLNNRGDFGQL